MLDNMSAPTSDAADTEAARIAQLKMVAHGIIVPSICFIGMGLNIINLIVLRDKRLKESCYTYLVGLAVADFLSLLMFGVNGIGRGHYNKEYGWALFDTYVYFPVCLITTMASVFLIVTVTAERFVFLYWPIPSRLWCTCQVARRIVAGAWTLSVLLNTPRFFVAYVDENGEKMRTEFGQSELYKIITWILFFLIAVGCGVILIVFNVLLIKGIHDANKRRRSLRSHNENEEKHEEIRLTRTLISVIFLYLIGEIPSSIFSRIVFSAILNDNQQHLMDTLWYEACVAVATIFVVCQHSLNFVFYCVFNKRFFAVFKSHFWRCDKKCREPLNSEIATVMNLTNEIVLKKEKEAQANTIPPKQGHEEKHSNETSDSTTEEKANSTEVAEKQKLLIENQ